MNRFASRLLLAVAAILLTLLAVAGVRKLLDGRRSPPRLTELTREDRQRLAEELLEVGGAGYTPAWFEPQVGYTLVPNAELTLWNDTFKSNEIGYRAPRLRKPPGTFRVVLVGDSWTYGLGVSAAETFSARLEALAAGLMPEGPRVETWPLALPGYNTMNEVAALEIFFDWLQPDSVVLCPTLNDNDSNFFVLPSGSPKRPEGDFVDRFGHDHWLSFQYRFLSSYLWRQRWKQAMTAIRETELWLAEREVPFLLFFVAFWEPPIVHDLVSEAGIEAPYLIAPKEMVGGRWSGPKPWGHGTPEAYEVYGRMLYRGLGERLGWPSLAVDPGLDPEVAELFPRPPAGDWARRAHEVALDYSRQVPTRFEPGTDHRPCAGNMDCSNGLMGRRTTLLLRRVEGARTLAVEVERIEQETALYPLRITASIPTAGGGASITTTVPAAGPKRHRFHLDLPADVEPGEVMAVQLRAERATLAPRLMAPRTVHVMLLEQESR